MLSGDDKLSLKKVDINGDNINEIIMENKQVLYVLDTSCGGVINYVYDKRNCKKFH